VLAINMFLPSLRQRRVVAGMMGRVFLWLSGIPFTAEGWSTCRRHPAWSWPITPATSTPLRIVAALRRVRLRHQERMVRVPWPVSYCAVSVRNSSSDSTGTRVRPMRAAS